MKVRNTTEIKRYEGRNRIKDFIAIVRDGKIQQIKKLPDNNFNGYVLPRQIDENDLEEYFGKCSNCGTLFPDMLNECEHCNELFCCNCAMEHTSEIDTGGCNF